MPRKLLTICINISILIYIIESIFIAAFIITVLLTENFNSSICYTFTLSIPSSSTVVFWKLFIRCGQRYYRSFVSSSPPLQAIGISWWQATLWVALSLPFAALNWPEWEQVRTVERRCHLARCEMTWCSSFLYRRTMSQPVQFRPDLIRPDLTRPDLTWLSFICLDLT